MVDRGWKKGKIRKNRCPQAGGRESEASFSPAREGKEREGGAIKSFGKAWGVPLRDCTAAAAQCGYSLDGNVVFIVWAPGRDKVEYRWGTS